MLGGFGIFELLICLLILALGLIIFFVFQSERKKRNTVQSTTKACPYCAENIKVEAKVCRYCGRKIASSPLGIFGGILLLLGGIGLIAFPFIMGVFYVPMWQNFLCWAPGAVLIIVGIYLLSKSG